MKTSLERKIFFGFATAVAVPLGVGIVAWWNAQRFASAFQSVDHTHGVLYQLEQTKTNLLVLQASSRGYALTANETLLKTYEADESSLRDSQGKLRQLVTDNPAQLRRLDKLDPLVVQITDLFRERIATRRTAGLEAVARSRSASSGPPIMDVIRDLIGEMETDERRLLQERSANSQVAARTTIGVVLVSSGLAALFATAAGLLVRRDFILRRGIERDLQHERYLLGELMANASEAIYFKDRDSCFIRVNRCVSDRVGLSDPRDVVGKTDADFFTADHAQQARADELAVMRTGQPLTKEEKETWPDGRVSWALTVKLPLRDESGAVVGTFGLSRDITGLKLAQQTAVREQARLKFIFDTMPVGLSFALTQPDGGVTRLINDAHLRICGLTREQADDPENFRRISHPEDYQRQTVFVNQLEAGTIDRYTIDKRYVRPNGENVWVMLSFLRRRCDDGGHEDLSMVVDITERHQAEAERDRFFTLSLDMLCIANTDGYFKRLSPSFTDTLGWSVEEMLQRPFIDFVHPDDRAATLREVERQVAAGEAVLHFENRYRHKDSSWRVLSWKSVPAAGGFMYATARDVTELKATEEKIRQLNASLAHRAAQLEAANAELEAFSYSVSHDLRAPLRHINGFAGLLEKRASATLDEQARRYVATVRESAMQMGQLIDDLLAFSRIGRAPLALTEVDHDALVTAVVRDGRYDGDGRAIVWEIPLLPRVRADAAMLRQVWANLLDNAVKYSRHASPARIAIHCQSTDGARPEHVFSVRDNGVGFDPAYADKLFGVFQRLHSAADFEGTGIGLANVHRIVARHGGRTWAESKIGQGATFFFSLPSTTASQFSPS